MNHICVFRMSGIPVAVNADDPSLFRAVKDFFSGYTFLRRMPAGRRITMNLTSRRTSPIQPAHRPVLFTYGRIKGYRLEHGLLLSDTSTFVTVDHRSGTVDAYVDPRILERGTEFVSIFITIAIIDLLRLHGLYYLHASAVRSRNRSVLLCGMGMSGKTTLSLGLLFNGYRLCSDDAVFLRHDDGAVRAVGFKKDIHVTAETLALYKARLRGIKPPRPPFHKASVPYRRFSTAGSITPDTIVFLQPGDRQHSKVEAIEPTRAMSLLIPQSLMLFFHHETAGTHVRVLNALLHQTHAYLCFCGRDLLQDPLIIFKSTGT